MTTIAAATGRVDCLPTSVVEGGRRQTHVVRGVGGRGAVLGADVSLTKTMTVTESDLSTPLEDQPGSWNRAVVLVTGRVCVLDSLVHGVDTG